MFQKLKIKGKEKLKELKKERNLVIKKKYFFYFYRDIT